MSTYAEVFMRAQGDLWWVRFSDALKRRTYARTGFCRHRRWEFMRDVCAGCGMTGQQYALEPPMSVEDRVLSVINAIERQARIPR